ncbi:AraC family transcriptional regulator [uncultured Tateyamaria sp.]|uniref:helix-turn-helix transcriptional regulator n=1 Tax=uncultured Tateyamaria sp. TaxID=455651 RepID=UPI00261548B0|nr:AraC family transcriptional regulator [uncultured Tateyamaria sp.]
MPRDDEDRNGLITNILTLGEDGPERDARAFYGYVTQTNLIGGAGGAIIKQVNCPGGEFDSPPFDDYHLHIALTTSRRTYSNFDGLIREGRGHAGQLGLAPRATRGELAVEGTFSSLHIAVPQAILRRTADALDVPVQPDLESLFSIYFHDPAILWVAQSLAETALLTSGRDAFHADQSLWALSALLLQRAGTIELARRNTSPLDADAFGKVHDMFVDHIELPLTIQDLADRVSMDVFSFSRAFKSRTGRSPYQYLLQLRVERALHLLLSTDISLIETAYACGFSSQAHFNTVFRKVMGMTPGMVRARR